MASDLVATLLSDPLGGEAGESLLPYKTQDVRCRQLLKTLRALDAGELTRPTDGGATILELLDPKRNTIAYMFALLDLRIRASTPHLLNATLTFLGAFDPVQARYVGKEMRVVLEWLAGYYENTHDMSAIPAIGTAILRLDPSGSTFTSNHLLFVQLCLAAGLPRLALPILDKDIYNLPMETRRDVDDVVLCAPHQMSSSYITKSSGISAELKPFDVQEYYLLGANIYIGMRRYERARLFLELVLASPTQHTASQLMVEAYKKLILLGLLSTGRLFFSSGMLDPQTSKALSSLSKPYETLADAFRARSTLRFHAELDTARAIWAEDGNTALVNHVAESLRRYRIIDLQNTYAALPVSRIAQLFALSTEDTLTFLSDMIRDGHINATLQHHHNSPTLRFLSHNPSRPKAASPLTQDAALLAKQEQIARLSKHVKETDRKLAISKEYVDYVRRSKRAEGAGAAGFEDPMEESWDGPPGGADADEDMMADL